MNFKCRHQPYLILNAKARLVDAIRYRSTHGCPVMTAVRWWRTTDLCHASSHLIVSFVGTPCFVSRLMVVMRLAMVLLLDMTLLNLMLMYLAKIR